MKTEWPTLIHFSAEPLGTLFNREQDKRPHFKPNGLWVSVEDGEDGWKSWCEIENFNPESLAHETEIRLTPHANILWLKTATDILDFTGEFKRGPKHISFSAWSMPFSYRNLDWLAVSQQWQGILIVPYQYSLRLDDRCNWYYTWDCSSGCIWDASAISEAIPIDAGQRGQTADRMSVQTASTGDAA